MSNKWINNDLFGKFQDQKKEEKTKTSNYGNRRSDLVWDTPAKGTETQAKEYQGRFLPDPTGEFYKLYYYHMFPSQEKWMFVLCPKTHGFEHYCPWCSITAKLYSGTAADKKMANMYKRKRKYVGNFFITKDPRDEDKDADDKVVSTVRLYEFPVKVEMKLKEEITDTENGLGASIFDPTDTGYNFILKVLSTKATPDGKTWPDYAQSTFSRRSSALGSDSEIEAIMKTTHDISEYVKGMMKSDDEIEKSIKDEHLWDFVSKEWANVKAKVDEPQAQLADDIDDQALYEKHLKNEAAKEQVEEPAKLETTTETSPPWEGKEEAKEEKVEPADQTDAELLKELAAM